jgi:hypothetical protein
MATVTEAVYPATENVICMVVFYPITNFISPYQIQPPQMHLAVAQITNIWISGMIL